MEEVTDEGFWKMELWRIPRGPSGCWILNWWRAWPDLSGVISPCCVSLCLLRSTFLWKDLTHKSHENGLYPVCFLVWVIKLLLWLNALPQTMHLCGFSPEKRIRRNAMNLAVFFHSKKEWNVPISLLVGSLKLYKTKLRASWRLCNIKRKHLPKEGINRLMHFCCLSWLG